MPLSRYNAKILNHRSGVECTIAIIDYGAGSLCSVGEALLSLGEMPVITRDRKTVLKADKAILPGVGSFGDAMGELKWYDLVGVICRTVGQGTPFLDICLGLQLLFANGGESQGAIGLGIPPRKILKILRHPGLKTLHMGWSPLKIRPEAKLLRGIENRTYVCFVHSYYLKAEDESVVAASTEYSTTIHASVEWGNMFACQFHPEKSGKVGLTILKNFIGL